MKNTRTFKIGLLLSSFLVSPFAYGAVDTATLNAAASTGAFVLDRLTGDLYVGLATGAAGSTITKLSDNGSGITETGVSGTNVTSKTVRLMAPLYIGTSLNLAFCESTTATTKVGIQSADGTTEDLGDALTDAGSAAVEANGILALAGSNLIGSNYAIFAAVAGNGSTSFNNANSGVSVINVATDGTLALTSADAVATPKTAHATGQAFAIANTATISGTPSLYWDDTLQRLYIGGGVILTGATIGDGAVGVLCARTTGAAGNLTIDSSVANTAAFAGSDLGAVYTRTTDTTKSEFAVYNLGVMHTSTGFAYLIINGGPSEATGGKSNLVYAQPLVTRNGTTAVDGTFAKHDLNSADFSVQASAAGDMVTTSTASAAVGGLIAAGTSANPLPFTNDTLTKMQIVGDAVFVSSSVLADGANDEAGIFYSTPEFNENGKITRWSRWTRVATDRIGTGNGDGDVQNFAINPRNGKVWAIEGDGTTIANLSTWGDLTAATELAGAVNAVLTDGCTAIGVFDRTTINWGNNVGPRMSLFGGNEKVVFTVQSRTDADPNTVYSVVEGPIGDTANGATNFLSTTLPSGAGYVTAIGGTLNAVKANTHSFYFLAGTTAGLYAYATTSNGFGATLDYADNGDDTIHNLDGTAVGSEDQFFNKTNSWQAITSVTGHIKAIKSSATLTAILARDTGTDGTIADTLYIIRNASTVDTIAELIAEATSIAVSGVSATNSDLSAATEIFDFTIINGVTAGTDSQIILATNNGLYQSKTATGIEAATTQATALWTPIGQKAGNTGTAGVMYSKLLNSATTNLNNSFRAIKVVDDSNHNHQYDYRGLDQFCCSDDDNGATGNEIRRFPNDDHYFNSDSFSSFLRLNRILDYWSDGGRRAFIATPADGSGTTGLYWLPYNVSSSNWNVTDPISAVSATALANKRLYCVNMLPDGHICVGHESGIAVM